MNSLNMARQVAGKCIAHIAAPTADRLTIHFTDGTALQIQQGAKGFRLELVTLGTPKACPAALQPTNRQRDYLAFIEKYMGRFGGSPAESDIQRHFLASAPSVNAMMQTLERRGFISRQPGVPRSIRLNEPVKCDVCGGTHFLKES